MFGSVSALQRSTGQSRKTSRRDLLSSIERADTACSYLINIIQVLRVCLRWRWRPNPSCKDCKHWTGHVVSYLLMSHLVDVADTHLCDFQGKRVYPLTLTPKPADAFGLCPYPYVNPLPTDQVSTSQHILSKVLVSHRTPLLSLDQIANMAAPHLPTSPQPIPINFSFSLTLERRFSSSSNLLTPSPLCVFWEQLTSEEDLHYSVDGHLFLLSSRRSHDQLCFMRKIKVIGFFSTGCRCEDLWGSNVWGVTVSTMEQETEME